MVTAAATDFAQAYPHPPRSQSASRPPGNCFLHLHVAYLPSLLASSLVSCGASLVDVAAVLSCQARKVVEKGGCPNPLNTLCCSAEILPSLATAPGSLAPLRAE